MRDGIKTQVTRIVTRPMSIPTSGDIGGPNPPQANVLVTTAMTVLCLLMTAQKSKPSAKLSAKNVYANTIKEYNNMPTNTTFKRDLLYGRGEDEGEYGK